MTFWMNIKVETNWFEKKLRILNQVLKKTWVHNNADRRSKKSWEPIFGTQKSFLNTFSCIFGPKKSWGSVMYSRMFQVFVTYTQPCLITFFYWFTMFCVVGSPAMQFLDIEYHIWTDMRMSQSENTLQGQKDKWNLGIHNYTSKPFSLANIQNIFNIFLFYVIEISTILSQK